MSFSLVGGKFSASTSTGAPAVGYLLYSYSNGTTTPKITYSDSQLSTANTNPIVLNARGEARVWLQNVGAYTFKLTDATGVTIWTEDGISDPQASIDASSAGVKADLASSAAGKGSAMVAYGSATVKAKLDALTVSAIVNVKDYGAIGNGSTDDTTAFTNALAVSKNIYVPSGTYLLNGLNVEFGVKISGAGTIKTSSGALIDLGTADMAPHSEFRMMFLEGNKPSWEEMLHIKSCGYTCVMAYPWHLSLDAFIRNCEAVGLNVVMYANGIGTTSVPAVITPYMTYDSRPSVIGYYILDEPAGNAISVSEQDRAIAAYRAATKKPLYCAENVVSFSTGVISANWDVILVDQYYPNSITTANDVIASMIKSWVEFGATSKNCKLIPTVGLFNDTGFNKSATAVTSLADTLLRFSPDGSFAVFAWDAGVVAGAYVGVRNTPAYLAAAKQLVGRSIGYKPYRVEMVALGDAFGGNNKLHAIWKNTKDGASPGIPGASLVTPWEVINVGSNVDARQQNFASSGLMISATGGNIGFSDMPSGICCAFLQYSNQANAATCTVNLGASKTGGYSYPSAVVSSGAMANNTAWSGYAQLSPDTKVMPILAASLSISSAAPYVFLKGYIVFTDIQTVSF